MSLHDQDDLDSIAALYQRYLTLKHAYLSFNASKVSALSHVLFSPVTEIREDTFAHYQFIVKLNQESLIVALLSALLLTSMVEMIILEFVGMNYVRITMVMNGKYTKKVLMLSLMD